MTIAQSMHNEGLLISGDIHEHKCRILRQRLQEFGITISQVVCRDASAPCEDAWKGSFHRVLCDVPCSGLGVIGRKPEIRYRWREEVDSLPALQLKILEQGAEMVRPGEFCSIPPARSTRRKTRGGGTVSVRPPRIQSSAVASGFATAV